MTVIDKKMNLDRYDTLDARLDEAFSVIRALVNADEDYYYALMAPAELLSQARDALNGLFVESD